VHDAQRDHDGREQPRESRGRIMKTDARKRLARFGMSRGDHVLGWSLAASRLQAAAMDHVV
jgi:hypothetical protein